MTNRFLITLTMLTALSVPLLAIATAWTASSTSTDISSALLSRVSDFEPSGIIWHEGRGTYIVVGDGSDVAEISATGTVVNSWGPSGNWEGITVADTASDLVYLADENRSAIYAFDLGTGALTGDRWSVSSYIYPVGYAGLEALTWVPDGFHDYGTTVSGGVFYAGWQYDADMYVFEADLSTSGSITYLDEVRTTSGYSDLSGLYFSEATGTIFTLYDGADRLEERETDGTLIASYTIPESGDWEGLAAVDGCPTSGTGTMTLADDSGSVNTFARFPYNCLIVDEDGDGVYSDTDCNDADASVSSDQTYWADVDGDGYGDAADATTLCSSEAPSGYVDNADDAYPNNRIEICNDGRDNDGDSAIDEANTLGENRAHPVFSAYSASASGYVSAVSIARSGAAHLTYTDGSCYDYTIFTPARGYRLTAVSGTSYYTATVGSLTVTLNGLTGEVTGTTTWIPSTTRSPAKKVGKVKL
ncbi:hypothetical protein HY631_04285 [Candidatus Uhrbacteria bacterium]|nr:hypothetical protein [Candidatus Uhrbacteria bacterium]